jgi:predicted NodU family carbamoyl transferase
VVNHHQTVIAWKANNLFRIKHDNKVFASRFMSSCFDPLFEPKASDIVQIIVANMSEAAINNHITWKFLNCTTHSIVGYRLYARRVLTALDFSDLKLSLTNSLSERKHKKKCHNKDHHHDHLFLSRKNKSFLIDSLTRHFCCRIFETLRLQPARLGGKQ